MRFPNAEQFRGAVVGGILLALVVGACLAVPFLWVVVLAVVVWWALAQERVYRATNHSPTGDPEGAEDESPLFSVWEDRPGHCVVEWPEGADITDGEDDS